MGIRLDQLAPSGLTESQGHLTGTSVPRRPASSPPAGLQPQLAIFPESPSFPETPGPVEVAHADLRAAVEEINQGLRDLQTTLDIVRDEASGRSAVIVRDAEGNVLRQIPPEAVLHAFVQVRQIVGLLLDETA